MQFVILECRGYKAPTKFIIKECLEPHLSEYGWLIDYQDMNIFNGLVTCFKAYNHNHEDIKVALDNFYGNWAILTRHPNSAQYEEVIKKLDDVHFALNFSRGSIRVVHSLKSGETDDQLYNLHVLELKSEATAKIVERHVSNIKDELSSLSK